VKNLLLGVLVLVALTLAWMPFAQMKRTATAELGGGIEVSMHLRPMVSMQSDWHRTLILRSPSGRLKTQLFEDTGWWRGSNLYFHETGVYVLHEGQGGCVPFTLLPPELVLAPEISCAKAEIEPGKGAAMGQVGALSRYYRGMRYLGQFTETRRDSVAIRFIEAAQAPEPELPDLL
jgi:hypothetical protein